MRKSMLNLVLVLAATAPIGASAAWAQIPPDPSWVPAYSTYYYSDASRTHLVGSTVGYCTFWGPRETPPEGQVTEFTEQVLAVWCDENGIDHPI